MWLIEGANVKNAGLCSKREQSEASAFFVFLAAKRNPCARCAHQLDDVAVNADDFAELLKVLTTSSEVTNAKASAVGSPVVSRSSTAALATSSREYFPLRWMAADLLLIS